jgi:glycosyltransferase involved in cell wall biosynthesis
MIKVLVVPSDTVGGVGFYRSFQPHEYLSKNYGNEFEIKYSVNPDWNNHEELSKYDIIHVHRGIFNDMKAFFQAIVYLKTTNTVTVMDIDDSWELSPTHPQYQFHKRFGISDVITSNLKIFDYVTTTTPIFAKEIFKYNKHVIVLPNAIDPSDERFHINKAKSDKLRFGFVMGSTHEYDLKTMGNFIEKLPTDVLDKIEIVLCGFDLKGKVFYTDPITKEQKSRPVQPKETVWHRYEQMVTNNGKILSDDYKMFLDMFIPDLEYPNINNEHYRRCFTKDIDHYFKHYNNIDVLFAPLEVKTFNKVKSQLKAIECAFSTTALIATDYGPYQIDLTNMINSDGSINEKGNAILIKPNSEGDWAKYITLLVNNPSLIKKLQSNLQNTLVSKYNLGVISDLRAETYRNMVQHANK